VGTVAWSSSPTTFDRLKLLTGFTTDDNLWGFDGSCNSGTIGGGYAVKNGLYLFARDRYDCDAYAPLFRSGGRNMNNHWGCTYVGHTFGPAQGCGGKSHHPQ
jgi:hypothetical protein